MQSIVQATRARLAHGANVVKFVMVSPYPAIDGVGRALRSLAGMVRVVVDPGSARSEWETQRARLATRLIILKEWQEEAHCANVASGSASWTLLERRCARILETPLADLDAGDVDASITALHDWMRGTGGRRTHPARACEAHVRDAEPRRARSAR